MLSPITLCYILCKDTNISCLKSSRNWRDSCYCRRKSCRCHDHCFGGIHHFQEEKVRPDLHLYLSSLNLIHKAEKNVGSNSDYVHTILAQFENGWKFDGKKLFVRL